MAKTVTLSDSQKAKLTAAGIDWQKLLTIFKEVGPMILALLSYFIDKTPLPVMKAKNCPDPEPGEISCCHAAQIHILSAALCVEGHCCSDKCCPTDCCEEALGHLMKAVHCCLHCCEAK